MGLSHSATLIVIQLCDIYSVYNYRLYLYFFPIFFLFYQGRVRNDITLYFVSYNEFIDCFL